MDGFEKAKLKDYILTLLPAIGDTMNHYAISNLLKPDFGIVSPETVTSLLKEISQYDSTIIDFISTTSYLVKKTQFTQPFLDKGGFVKLYNDEQMATNTTQLETRRIRKKEVQKERRQSILDILKIVGLVVSIPISCISLYFSLGAKELGTNQLDLKLEGLETRVEELEKTPKIIKDTIK